jgi:hypothetical protein
MIKSRDSEMSEAYGTYREEENASKVLIGKPRGKRPPVRPKHRWNILN